MKNLTKVERSLSVVHLGCRCGEFASDSVGVGNGERVWFG